MRTPGNVVAALVLVAGCTPQGVTITVDLHTDLAPGRDFYAVRDVLDGPMAHYEHVEPALVGDDFRTGRRVAELGGAPTGAYRLTTELLGLSRAVVVTRLTDVAVARDVALTVGVSRACRGVTCPGPHDDASHSTCVAGRCADPRCSSADPSSCPVDCTADADCPPRAGCATSTCGAGACFYTPGAACPTGQVCDPDVGCVTAMVTCAAPLVECGSTCTDVLNDASSCGGCGHVCTAPAGATATCAAGTCGFTCAAGTHHCGATCDAMPCGATVSAPGTSQFPVPDGCTQLDVLAWGAGGGAGQGAGQSPGAGGFAGATLDVMPGEMLTVVVGAPGSAGAGGVGGAGGAPGGGSGGGSGTGGGGGGGYSGVFRGVPAQANALVIAGAGGGCGGRGYQGGAGGGFSGGSNANSAPGGTQTAGGAAGGGGGTPATAGSALAGGAGGSRSDGGGGGGAGWFGGGGNGGASTNAGGGGGGSGYVTPTAATFALAAGTDAVAGADGDPRRGTAGDPGQPGLVALTCH